MHINLNQFFKISHLLVELNIHFDVHTVTNKLSGDDQADFAVLMSYLDKIEHFIYKRLNYAVLNSWFKVTLNKYITILKEVNSYHEEFCAVAIERQYFWLADEEQRVPYDIIKENFFKLYEELSKEGAPKRLASMLFKIVSRPAGQKLLLNIVQLLLDDRAKKLLFKMHDHPMTGVSGSIEQGLPHDDIMGKTYATKNPDIQTIDITAMSNYEGALDLAIMFGAQHHHGECANTIVLDTQTNHVKRGVAFFPAFLVLAHELIHCMHYFRIKSRRQHTFSDVKQKKIFENFENPEEYWTIIGGKTSEHAIAKEHNLSVLRMSLAARYRWYYA